MGIKVAPVKCAANRTPMCWTESTCRGSLHPSVFSTQKRSGQVPENSGLPNQQAALLFAKETHGLVSESTCLGLLSSNLKAATLALIIKTCSIWGSKNMVPVFLAACDPQVHTHLHVFLRPDLGDHVRPPSGMIWAAWWYTYPSEKWWSSSVGMMKFPIYYGKIKTIPNHQPDEQLVFLLSLSFDDQ